MSSYEEIAEFWDTHSLADYWEQTEPADLEIDPHARRRYLVALDPELLQRVQKLAQSRELSTESLVNLLLEQRIHQLESRGVDLWSRGRSMATFCEFTLENNLLLLRQTFLSCGVLATKCEPHDVLV